MKHLYYLSIWLLLNLLHLPAGQAQQPEKTVSGAFNRVPFEQFAAQLEAQTDYRFYFDPAAVDSLFITLQVQDAPLRSVLERALPNTAFYFAIDDERRVIITTGAPLETTLPPGFLHPGVGTTPATALNPADEAPPPVPPAARATCARPSTAYMKLARAARAAAKLPWPATSGS